MNGLDEPAYALSINEAIPAIPSEVYIYNSISPEKSEVL